MDKIVNLIKAGSPTVNNRYYNKEDLQRAVDEFSTQPLRVVVQDRSELNSNSSIEHIIGTAELEMDGDQLIGKIKLIDNTRYSDVYELLEFTTLGMGKFAPAKDGATVVTDFKLLSIAAFSKLDEPTGETNEQNSSNDSE